MNKFRFFIYLVILIFAFSCRKEDANPARDLLQEAIRMVGGEKRLSEIQTIVRTGKVKVFTPDGMYEGDISISIRKNPAGVHILQNFGGEEIIQSYNGNLSWHETFCSDPMPTPEFNHFFDLFARIHAGGLALGLTDTAVLSLKEEAGASPSLTLQLDSSLAFTVYFNRATSLPEKSAFETEINPDGTMLQYSCSYGGYKNIEGLRLPHQWTCFCGNEKIAEIEFSDILLKNPLDDSLFQPTLEIVMEDNHELLP